MFSWVKLHFQNMLKTVYPFVILCVMKNKDEIAKKYERLVYKIASKFCYGDDIDDLIQAGYVGLMEAVDRYDDKKDGGLSYYAKYIEKYVRLELYNNRTAVSVPSEVMRIAIAITAIFRDMTAQLNREPTDREMFEQPYIKLLNAHGKIRFEIKHYVNLANPKYLDDKIYPEKNDATYMDVLVDDSVHFTDEVVEYDLIEEVMRALSAKEKYVVTMSIGLFGNVPMSFREISKEIGLSMQRTQAIYTQAIEKMQKRFKGQKMVDFWEEL